MGENGVVERWKGMAEEDDLCVLEQLLIRALTDHGSIRMAEGKPQDSRIENRFVE